MKIKGDHIGGIAKSLKLKFSLSVYEMYIFAGFYSVLDRPSYSPFPENKPLVFHMVGMKEGWFFWCPERTLKPFTSTCICNGEDSSKV